MKENIKEALLAIGCTQPSSNEYLFDYKGYRFKIYDSTTLPEIFDKLIKMGATLKTWEVKQVLEIVS